MAIRRISDYLGTSAPGTSGQPGTPPPTSKTAKAKVPSRALVPTQPPAVPAAPAPAAPAGDAALLSAELNDMTEVIDALATTVADVSDRVDKQTEALGKLARTTTEARQAAFAARDQSDPGQLASEVTDALNVAMVPRLRELTRTAQAHGEARNRAESQLHDMRRELRAARAETLRWKGYLAGAVLSGVLLAVVLFLVLPRVVPPTPFACALAGGRWLNDEACVFWAPEWNR